MVLVEIVTKHYDILGKRTPIQLTFYDNGGGCQVVARHTTLNFTVSSRIGENMDREITAKFESLISTNMGINNIQNFNQYVQYNHNKMIAVENPDNDEEDSVMFGFAVN